MPGGIGIRVVGAQAALRRFERLARLAEDLTPLHDRIGIKILQWVMRNFEHGGLEHRWAPLRPGTAYSRRQGGGGASPLQDTGRLKASFSYRASKEETVVGSPGVPGLRDLPLWHQEGTEGHGPDRIYPTTKKALSFPWPFGQRHSAALVRKLWLTPQQGARRGAFQRMTSFQLQKRSRADFSRLNFGTFRSVRWVGVPARPLLPSRELTQHIAQDVIQAYFQELLHG